MKTDAGVDVSQRAAPGTGLKVMVINSVLMGGGVDTQTLSQCEALVLQGAQVWLVISDRSRWIDRARQIPGLQVWVMTSRRWRWPLQLAGRVRALGVHVLHAHHGRDYWLAILTRLLSRQPAAVVVTRHLMTALKEKTRRYLAPHAHVVAVSEAVLRALRASDPGETLRLHKVYCGIDARAFQPGSSGRQAMRETLGVPQNAWLFGVVGAIHAPDGKGQFLFLRAARQVLDRHPDAHFLCAGSGEAVPALQALAQTLGLGEHFHWRPFGDAMPEVMQAIDVLVHPAVSSEAFGLVVLEALSCGKPVIASDLDGLPETFSPGENGLLVPARDLSQLSQAMMRLADDRALAVDMGSKGRAWIEGRFTLDHVGAALAALYRQILSSVHRHDSV